MTNHERIKLAFGDVRAPKDLSDKILKTTRNTTEANAQVLNRKRLIRTLTVAAIICIVVGGTAAAYMIYIAGLRDLALPDTGVTHTYERPDGTVEERPEQLISLSGFMGSPEHAASVEWQEFLNTYDVWTAAATADADGDWGGVPEEYRGYGVYSLEMLDKIKEIMERHGLSLRGEMLDINTQEELQESIAYGPLFTDESIWFMGYQYSCGTFQFDASYGEIGFQFRSSRKGVFDEVYLNIGNIDEYTEWNYENAHGTQLLLAQNSFKSLILLETEVSFIVVNILAGTAGDDWNEATAPFTGSDLERFADLTDFTKLRSETPDISIDFEAQRAEHNDTVSPLVGRWNHESSELANGAAQPMSEVDGLKIYDNRLIFLWSGAGVLENYENYSPDFSYGLSAWYLEGEIIPAGEKNYTVALLGMMGPSDDDFHRWLDTMQHSHLTYDPGSGLLKFTFWNGDNHFFKRES